MKDYRIIVMQLRSHLAGAALIAVSGLMLFSSVSRAQVPAQTALYVQDASSGLATIVAAAGGGTFTLPGSITGTFITTGNLSGITTTGTLLGGSTGAGFTLALGSSTITGQLAVANGGTGQGSALTDGGVIYANSTTAMASTLSGTASQVLHGNGTGTPAFSAVALASDVSGTLPVANGGTASGWSQVKVASNVALSTTAATVATFSCIASTTYEFEAYIDCNGGSGATDGVLYAVSSNGSSPTVAWVGQGNQSSSGGSGSGAIGNGAYNGNQNWSGSSNEGMVHITGFVKTGSGASTVTLLGKTNANTGQVNAGSKLLYRVQ